MSERERRNLRQKDVYIGGRLGPAINWVVRNSGLSRLILWFCFDYHGRTPKILIRIAPCLFGLAVGRKPHRISREEADREIEEMERRDGD